MKQAIGIQELPEIGTPRKQQTKTILAVDDDPLLLDLVELILDEERCYRVLRARSGPQALQVASQAPEPPDLLLLDYAMPGMTGLELYDLLHAQPRYAHTPAIMVSASLPPPEELAKRHLIGLAKPYDIGALTDQIESVIAGDYKTLV